MDVTPTKYYEKVRLQNMNVNCNTIKTKIISKDYLILFGYLAYFLVFMAAVIYVISKGFVAWPFREAESTADVYRRSLIYAPVVLFSLSSLLWLKAADIPVWEWFQWKQFHPVFLAGLGISAGYALYLLSPEHYRFRGIACWTPVIMLCILNAFSEELVYRVVLLKLFKNISWSFWQSNLIQSLIYALPHIEIVGLKTAVYSFLYGMLMGWIFEKNRSVIPCMVCHFCVDIGMIGLPVCRIY